MGGLFLDDVRFRLSLLRRWVEDDAIATVQGAVWPVVACLVAALAVLIVLGYAVDSWQWPGVKGKTLWNWIEVLGVPLTVAVIGGVFVLAVQNRSRAAEDARDLTKERARESALRSYLSRISDLILDQELQSSPEEAAVRAVAQAQTFAALRALKDDGPRKGILVRFLYEAKLIEKGRAVISLSLADLSGADLSGADLSDADLSGAILAEADLYEANLRGATVGEEQLASVLSLEDATMPDGTQMTEDRWRAFLESVES